MQLLPPKVVVDLVAVWWGLSVLLSSKAGKAKLTPPLLAKVVTGGVLLGVVGDFLVIHDGVGLVVNFGLGIIAELI